MGRRIAFGAMALILTLIMFGCAVQVQETKVDSAAEKARQDSIAKAQQDSVIKFSLMYSHQYMSQQNYERARYYYWQLVKADTENKYNKWGRLYSTYEKMGDIDSARIVLRMGLERHPEDSYLNATLGHYMFLQGMADAAAYEEALQLYKNALKDPKVKKDVRLQYLGKKADIEQKLEMWDDAIGTLETILEITPDDQTIRDRRLGLIAAHRDPAEIIANLELEIAKDPNNISKRIELLNQHREQSHWDKVIEQADLILALEANNRAAFEGKARAFKEQDKFNESIANYKAMLDQYPDETEAMLRIADNYRKLNQFKSARIWITKARKVGDRNAEADYILGEIYRSCADHSVGSGSLKYDDKLVYLIAHGLYMKAAKSDDYNVNGKAGDRAKWLKDSELLPTKQDRFLHLQDDTPSKKDYGWMSQSWPEIKVLKSKLDAL